MIEKNVKNSCIISEIVLRYRKVNRKEESIMKTALVLEGGALRGVYTAGVLDVLMEKNIQVDNVIGVSAGALNGMNYISHQIRKVG